MTTSTTLKAEPKKFPRVYAGSAKAKLLLWLREQPDALKQRYTAADMLARAHVLRQSAKHAVVHSVDLGLLVKHVERSTTGLLMYSVSELGATVPILQVASAATLAAEKARQQRADPAHIATPRMLPTQGMTCPPRMTPARPGANDALAVPSLRGGVRVPHRGPIGLFAGGPRA